MISTWHRDFKDFPRITVSDKILYDKAFNITKNSKDDGSQKGLSSIVYELFYKRSSSEVIKNKNMSKYVKVHSLIMRYWSFQ